MRATTQHIVILMIGIVQILSGCTKNEDIPAQVTVVTTLPVVGQIVTPILGEQSVVILLDNGETPHSYQPTPFDVLSIESADLMILAHPDVDGWASDFAQSSVYYLFDSPDPDSPDSESLDPEPPSPDSPHNHEEVEHEHLDAHYWSDPVQVIQSLQDLAETLCDLSPGDCVSIRRKTTAFSARIQSTSELIEKELLNASPGCVVTAQPFMDHFLDRFGIVHLGPIPHEPGLSPLPRHLGDLFKEVQSLGCRTLLVQSAYAKGPYPQWAQDMGIDLHAVDATGQYASSYESYLEGLAEAVLTTEQ